VQSWPRARAAGLLAVVLISLAARVCLLLARPLWHDEQYTAWVSRLPTIRLVQELQRDSGPPLFYLFERPFARAANVPASDPLIRVLPFLAGLALFCAARSLPRGSPRRWWIAVCASFTLVNLYAAEARAYEPLSLACLGIFLFSTSGAEHPRRLAALFAVASAALWLHYLGLFAVGAALCLAAGHGRRRSALALAAALAAFAPWAPVLLAQPRGATAWLLDPPASAARGFLSALGGVGRIPAPFGPTPPPGLFGAGLVAGGAMLLLLASAARRDPAVALALADAALVLAFAVAVSLWRPAAFAGRSEMAVLPVWMWAVARAAPASRALRAAAAAACALGLLSTLFIAAGPHPRPTPGAAVASVGRLARSSDVVLAGPGFLLPARLAEDRGLLAARVEALPPGDAAHPGWFIAVPPGADEEASLARRMESMAPGTRLFLLLPPSHDTPGTMRVLSSRGTVRELVRQPDGVLLVWSPPPAPAR
jgi:hypothetical protein